MTKTGRTKSRKLLLLSGLVHKLKEAKDSWRINLPLRLISHALSNWKEKTFSQVDFPNSRAVSTGSIDSLERFRFRVTSIQE